MRLALNVIWFVFGGIWLAVAYSFAALIMYILIVTRPLVPQAMKLAAFSARPFGRTVVRTEAGPQSTTANLIWLLLCGWWLALSHVLGGILMAATIIGIPLAYANFKLVPVALMPFGAEIVENDAARAHRRAAAPLG